MVVLCGQAALIQSRQLDMVWEQLVELGYQQVKCLDGLCSCLVLVLSLNSKFMMSSHWLLAWLTFPWRGLCVDEGDVLSCLHDTHSFQEEALIPESVGPGFLLFALEKLYSCSENTIIQVSVSFQQPCSGVFLLSGFLAY